MTRALNFLPGPATLPLEVIEQIRADLPVYPGAGASILELSHRSELFEGIIGEAEENIRALLGLDERFKVLFLQGGASTQFAMVPLNFLAGTGRTAEYLVTGAWGKKAAVEARRAGSVRVSFDGEGTGFDRVPDAVNIAPDAAYAHLTSNETVHGVQWPALPETGDVPLVIDASSDFLSRPMDVSRVGLLYAGAQKNIGAAGVTVVIIRQALLDAAPTDQFSMLDYGLQAVKRSMFNTPPVFAIYTVALVTRWLRHQIGGLESMAQINAEKARVVYGALDESDGFFVPHVQPGSRSQMNVTMRMATPELEARFVAEAAEAGLLGLKGHRMVGGLRASIYNAMPLAGAQTLADFMRDFQARRG